MARNTFNASLGVNLDPSSLNKSTREIKQALGRITGSASEFQKSLDASTARVFAFGATTAVINGVTQSFKALVSTTIEVEKRLLEIKSIFGGTASEFNQFRESIFQTARTTGQSFDVVASAAAEFARQGLSATETAKRLDAALVLTRISGLDSVKSTQALTAAINGFTSAGLTAEQITNKLVAVDTKFAVSAQDLAEGFSRAGSTAEDAGVSFDELLGIITAVQQTTSRGGAVIGNALKSIFTRLSRSSTIEDLQALGVAIDASQTGVQKLQALSNALAQISDPTKASQIKELAGGVYQINIVSAALKDLSNETSIFSQATQASANASQEAFQKNAELNKSLAAQINSLVAGFTNLAEKIGQLTLAPLLSGLISVTDSVSQFLNEALDPEKGNKFVQALLKTIGSFLSGPGLVLITTAFFKIFSQVAKYAKEGLKAILDINSRAESLKSIQAGIVNSLATDAKFRKAILSSTTSQAQIEKEVEAAIARENNLLQQREAILKRLAQAAYQSGARGFSQEKGFTGKGNKQLAGGFIPNFAVGKEMEKMAAEQSGYKAGRVYQTRIYDGNGGSFNSFVNSKEDITTFRNGAGKKATVVRPPNGFGENTEIAKRINASGFIPNFAKLPIATRANALRQIDRGEYTLSESGKTYLLKDGTQFAKSQLGQAQATKKQDSSVNLNAEKIIGQQLPTVLAPTGASDTIKTFKKLGNDRLNFAFSGYTLRQGGIDSLESQFENQFSDTAIDNFANKTALQYARKVSEAVGAQPAEPTELDKVDGAKGFRSSVRGAFGGIFDAAVSSALKLAATNDPQGEGGDFDIRAGAKSAFAIDAIRKLFGSSALPPSGLSDFKIGFGGDTKSSMVDKTYKEYRGLFDNYIKEKNELESGEIGGKVKAKTKAGGFIPNFAKYIYDSDRISPDKGATLKAILASSVKKNLILGPAGVGKSTLATGAGTFLTGASDVANATEIDILSGAARTKDGGLSKNLESLIAAVNSSGGKVSYLYAKNLDILSRRAGRTSAAEGDLRSKKQLAGTKYAPLNQFDFLGGIKSKSRNFNLIKNAGGYIPNFADPLKKAIDREMAAGVSASQIYVDRNSSLVNSKNPMGLMVANTRDEPLGGIQGIDRAKKEGRNPRTYGMGGGYVPNFAKSFTIDGAQAKADFQKFIGIFSSSSKTIQKDAEETGKKLSGGFGKLFDSVGKVQSSLLTLSLASNTLSDSNSEFNKNLQTGITILSTLDIVRSVAGGFAPLLPALKTFGAAALAVVGPMGLLVSGIGAVAVGLTLWQKKLLDDANERIDAAERGYAEAQSKFFVANQIKQIGSGRFAEQFRGQGVSKNKAESLGFEKFIKTLNQEGQGEQAQKILQASKDYQDSLNKKLEDGSQDIDAVTQAYRAFEEAVKEGQNAVSEHAITIRAEDRARKEAFASLNQTLSKFKEGLDNSYSKLGQFQTGLDIAKGVSIDTSTPQGKLTEEILKLRQGQADTVKSRLDLQSLFAGEDFNKLLTARSEATGAGLMTDKIKERVTSPKLPENILKTYFEKGAAGLTKGLSNIIGADIGGLEGSDDFIKKVVDSAEAFKKNIIETYGSGKEGIRSLEKEREEVAKRINELEKQRVQLLDKSLDTLSSRLNEINQTKPVDPTALLKGYKQVAQEKDPFKAAEMLRGLQQMEDSFVALRGDAARDQLRAAAGLTVDKVRPLEQAASLGKIDITSLRDFLKSNAIPLGGGIASKDIQKGQLSEAGLNSIIQKLEQIVAGGGRLAPKAKEQLDALKATQAGTPDEATRDEKKKLDEELNKEKQKRQEYQSAIEILTQNVNAFGETFKDTGLKQAVDSLQESVLNASRDFGALENLGKNLKSIADGVGPVLDKVQKDVAQALSTSQQALQNSNSTRP